MSYGLELYNPSGAMSYSTTDIALNQIDKFIVLKNETKIKNYSSLASLTIVVQMQMVSVPPHHQEAYAPKVVITGTKVVIKPRPSKTSEEVLIAVYAK